nr:hypothetical protein [Rhodococcus erythropolis]
MHYSPAGQTDRSWINRRTQNGTTALWQLANDHLIEAACHLIILEDQLAEGRRINTEFQHTTTTDPAPQPNSGGDSHP